MCSSYVEGEGQRWESDERCEDSLYDIAKKAKEQKTWDEYFAALVVYKNRRGTLLFDKSTKESNRNLYKWTKLQRKMQASLTKERRQKLKSIGFDFQVTKRRHSRSWKLMYERLKEHIKQSNATSPKILKGDQLLSQWVKEQRIAYTSGNLLEERKNALDSIGFLWGPAEEKATQWHRHDQESLQSRDHHDQHNHDIQKQRENNKCCDNISLRKELWSSVARTTGQNEAHGHNHVFTAESGTGKPTTGTGATLEVENGETTRTEQTSAHEYNKSLDYFLREVYVPEQDLVVPFFDFGEDGEKEEHRHHHDDARKQPPFLGDNFLTTDGKPIYLNDVFII